MLWKSWLSQPDSTEVIELFQSDKIVVTSDIHFPEFQMAEYYVIVNFTVVYYL